MKRLMAFLLCLCLVSALYGTAFAMNTTEQPLTPYTIDEPYIYPIQPGTDAWNALDNLEQKIAACHISEDILCKMTTEALLETVLNYPLLVNIFFYDNVDIGIAAVSAYFPGLDELFSRNDIDAVLTAYASHASPLDQQIPTTIPLYFAALSTHAENSSREQALLPLLSSTTLYTPRGSAISAYFRLTWSDHGLTETAVNTLNNQALLTYPSAELITDGNSPSYNCHSYAWYSQLYLQNEFWINNPTRYMSDGSYAPCYPTPGAKIYYNNLTTGLNGAHSGIVVRYTTDGIFIQSKWGALGLFIHAVEDCPYYSDALLRGEEVTITYYA